FFFQAEDGIRDRNVTGVQTCALPISSGVIHLRLSAVAARGITATAGNDCPGADRKSFCLLLGKNFCGMYISPLDWRRRLWLSMQIGRASCRERGGNAVVTGALKSK